MIKKIFFSIIAIAILLGVVIYSQTPKLPIISGYAAKKVCSCSFIADRSLESIEKEDLSMSLLKLSSNSVDRKNKTATSTVFGLGSKTAVYRDKLGCILLKGKDDHQIKSPSIEIQNEEEVYPYWGKSAYQSMAGVDYSKLDKAIDNFFDPSGNMDSIKTRSILVIHKDTIIAEQYANGIDKDTEILGWSMTKSITNAWVGMMVKDSTIALTDKDLFPAWATDERKEISLDHLMHMTSGLDWQEDYTTVSGATTMLFDSEDIVETASTPSLRAEPGEEWYYSSGTSNLVAGYLRSKFSEHRSYLEYPYRRIFDELGMSSAVLESDESGNYIGSSYCYATTRDWGRFGLLYLNDGIWNNKRLLPEGWTSYSSKEVSKSRGIYGAHFWLNKRGAAYKDAPYDLYSANGFQGQRVYIIPSKDLVIVRMGLNENLDFNQFLNEVISSIKY